MIDHENHAEWEFLVQLQMQQHCDRQKRIDRVFRYLKNLEFLGNFSSNKEASGEVLLRSKNHIEILWILGFSNFSLILLEF